MNLKQALLGAAVVVWSLLGASHSEAQCNTGSTRTIPGGSTYGTASTCSCGSGSVAGFVSANDTYIYAWATSGPGAVSAQHRESLNNQAGTYRWVYSADWTSGDEIYDVYGGTYTIGSGFVWDPNWSWTGQYRAVCSGV